MSNFAGGAGTKRRMERTVMSEQPSHDLRPHLASEAPTTAGAGEADSLEPLAPLTETEFETAFREPLSRTLDLETWHPGADLLQLYQRLQEEVAEAVRQEGRY